MIRGGEVVECWQLKRAGSGFQWGSSVLPATCPSSEAGLTPPLCIYDQK